jgi:hypothetical protein
MLAFSCHIPAMTHPRLQFLGPTTLFVTVLSAECAAWALSHLPSSELLWYVNLRVFGIFQRSYYEVATYTDVPYAQLFYIALPIMALACYGLVRNRALPLAIASNLSFVFAAFVIYSSISYDMAPRAASLSTVLNTSEQSIYLPLVMIAASLISFALSHFHYLRLLRRTA